MSLALAENPQVAQALGIGSTPPVVTTVESLQGLIGVLTFSSSDDTVIINTVGETVIDLRANGGGGVAGVSSLTDGTTTLTGAITFIGEGCSITASQDPSPAITFSIPVQDVVASLNGTSGIVSLVSADGSVTITPNIDTGEVDLSTVGAGVSGISVGVDATVTGAVTLTAGSNINLDINVDTNTITINASVPEPPPTGVTSIQVDSEGAVSGTVNIITGLGVSAVTNVDTDTITLSSDPYVGSCWLTAPQNFPTLTNVGRIIFDTQDPFNDNTVVSYNTTTGDFTVLRAGVYQLNWICSVSPQGAVWPTLSSVDAFISITLDPSTVRNTSTTLFVPYPSTSAGYRINTTVVVSLNVNATFSFGLQWQTAPTGQWGFFERSNTNGLGACASWSYIKALEV